MAKYIAEGNEYEVDLTKFDWIFGGDYEDSIPVYPDVDLEEIFVEEPILKDDDVYRYVILYYNEGENGNYFQSLELELDGVGSEIVCTREEIKMFNNLLNILFNQNGGK